MSRPRTAPATIAALSVAEELRVRVTGGPVAAMDALRQLDADLEAEGRRLPGLLVRFALRHEAKGLHALAIRDLTSARMYRG
jgi:hypothetical protein